jgi:hypothetical protein
MIPKPNHPCVPVGTLHIASYKDGGRTMQMPLVSKFLCCLEAELRRNWRVLPPTLFLFCAIMPMGVRCGERALQINRTLEKDRLILSFPPNPLVIVKAKAIHLVTFHRNKNPQTHPEASLLVPPESGRRGFQIIIRT